MKPNTRRSAVAVALLAVPASLLAGESARAEAAKPVPFNINAVDLPSALTQLAQQGDVQIVFGSDVPVRHHAKLVQGNYRTTEALNALLDGTGLAYRVARDNTIVVASADPGATRRRAPAANPPRAAASPVTPPSAANDASDGSPVLEEVIVTARLREEKIQEIPLAITSLSAKEIESRGVTDLRRLAYSTAGLQMDETGGKFFVSPVIRGQSQVARQDDENNTSIFIDGVYVSGRDGLDFSLVDVDRIEVIKGPQSALYGRNSYAGAINYITRKPGPETRASLTGTLGDAGRQKLAGSVSGTLIEDKLYGRLGGAYDDWDGSYTNTPSGFDIGGYKSKFGSLGLRFTPTENFEATGNFYYSKDDVDPGAGVMFAGNCERVGTKLISWCGEYPEFGEDVDLTGFDPRAFGLKRELQRSSLTMDYTLGGIALTSITGYNTIETRSLVDWERQFPGLPFAVVNATTRAPAGTVDLTTLLSGGTIKNREFSQELRASSSGESGLQWLAGASYYSFRNQTLSSPVAIDTSPIPAGLVAAGASATGFGTIYLPVPANLTDERTVFARAFGPGSIKKTETWAGFASLSYAFGALTSRAEVRYTSEKKTLSTGLDTTNSNFRKLAEKTFPVWTPRFTVDYKLQEDILVYGSVAKGAKAGGFNASAPTPGELPFEPETNWTYEVGLKSQWLDNRALVNLAVFDSEMSGIQITNQSPNGPAVFITRNGGTGRSRGFELETSYRPTERWAFSMAYSLADAQFKNAVDSSLRSYPSFATNQDVSGQPLPRQAKHLVNGSVEYQQPAFGDFEFYSRLDGRHESKKNGFTHTQLGWVGPRTIFNARFGLRGDNWDGVVWVNNLLNDETPILANTTLTLNDFLRLPVSSLPELRTYGVTVTYRF